MKDCDWLFNVTCNDISVIYVTPHRCAGGLKKKLNLRSGSQRHRHFVGFFNVPVRAPTRGHPFYTVISRKSKSNVKMMLHVPVSLFFRCWCFKFYSAYIIWISIRMSFLISAYRNGEPKYYVGNYTRHPTEKVLRIMYCDRGVSSLRECFHTGWDDWDSDCLPELPVIAGVQCIPWRGQRTDTVNVYCLSLSRIPGIYFIKSDMINMFI